ncbi:OPT-domain-containing protein [Mycena epipterygia]|nr:OPT-domain-containing protein [Mycena epipterygia]
MTEPQLSQQASNSAVHEKVANLDVGVIHAVPEDLLEAAEYAETMSSAGIEVVIHRIVEEHSYDPNFPPAVLDATNLYLFDPDLKESPAEYQRVYDELKVAAALMVINSPYAEVRAVVDNHDDPRVPASIFRTWVIGTLFVSIRQVVLFPKFIRDSKLRAVASSTSSSAFGISVGPNVAQICAVPVAKLMELLPTTEYTTFGYRWSLNPGPFNPKEHMVITIMVNVGFTTPYSTNIIWIQYLPFYFDQESLQLSTLWSKSLNTYKFLGTWLRLPDYGCAVDQPDWIRPGRPHASIPGVPGPRDMLRWFLYCFALMFCYFFFADFIFQALSFFNWMTWISPTNVNLAVITGNFGLGLNPLPTFDWNQFTLFVDPLISPFFTTFNFFLDVIHSPGDCHDLRFIFSISDISLFIWLQLVFENAGNLYDVTAAIGANTLFNQTSYEEYSPAYLSASYAVIYGVFFAVYTATLSHALLHHRRDVARGFRSIFSRRKTSDLHADIHVRLMMENYTEVPEWQYFLVLVCAIALGAAGVGVYPTQTSPAVVLYGVFLALIFAIPIGIIASITNVEVTLNVLAEMLGGLWFKGNAVAPNYFKSYGFVTTSQTISFAADLKLAHYCHVSPRLTFWAQIYATIISSFICTGILNFQMTKIPDVCTTSQVDHFTCPNINTFFTASVLWGMLGPKRMFGTGGIYNSLMWCFLIGAILPIPLYLLRKRVKTLEYVHLPVLLTGGLIWAPYSMANVWPAVPTGYLFNVFIKKRYLAWWSKYNYVTTTAFSAAIAICAITIFFAVEWPEWRGAPLNWSRNTRPFAGCDAAGCARLPIPDQGFFGPGPGEFH